MIIILKMKTKYKLETVSQTPLPGDNCAISTQKLKAGSKIVIGDTTLNITTTILEGHRFALKNIEKGQALLSWNLPFGYATRNILPGEYVVNDGMIKEMSYHDVEFKVSTPNFRNNIQAFQLDPLTFKPSQQVPAYPKFKTFQGFKRSGTRGVGTRNYIVILATNSRASSFVRLLDQKLKCDLAQYPNVDGIVAIAHTEGGGILKPNNQDLLLRTLAGFVVHPNVGAVLAVDSPESPVNNHLLENYLQRSGYPIFDLVHKFHNLERNIEQELESCSKTIRMWLPKVNQFERSLQPLSEIKIALQCGGSDAFSGISANPLVSWVAREIIRNGGSANHAETDELIGAESYMLLKAKNLEIAQKFLLFIERYKKMAAWHGVTAEGNPSGGNKLRGLYNITLKSIGAGMKRHPDVRLDDVIDYSQKIPGPGFYFMDSPGNDLESVAGQVASGANLIFFTTGNGSVTNFPFVPTIKVVTTTSRYELLREEMDVNAGKYLDGVSMKELGKQTFKLTCSVASGKLTKGEKSGHYQVSIWRDWRQRDRSKIQAIQSQSPPSGNPLTCGTVASDKDLYFQALKTPEGYVSDQVGLLLPTSLCSSQVSLVIAHQINKTLLPGPLSRIVTIPHSEGCGYASGESQDLFLNTLLSYLKHPNVGAALLLEHGCDKIHNGVVCSQLRKTGIDPAKFGTASIQLDGGLENVSKKVIKWFESKQKAMPSIKQQKVGIGHLSIGMLSQPPIKKTAAIALKRLVSRLLGNDTTLIVPENDRLLDLLSAFKIFQEDPKPTIAYGQSTHKNGFHIMANPGHHWTEALTGLAACGTSLILSYHGSRPLAGHPLVPILRVSAESNVCSDFDTDLDLVLTGDPLDWPKHIASLVIKAASQKYRVRALQLGHTDIQFTRGLLGFST